MSIRERKAIPLWLKEISPFFLSFVLLCSLSRIRQKNLTILVIITSVLWSHEEPPIYQTEEKDMQSVISAVEMHLG